MYPVEIDVGGRPVGAGHPVWVVAELSANHCQRFEQAAELVRAAARAGADAVKLQTYTPDTMTIDAKSELFRVGEGTLWQGRFLYDLYREAMTPWEWHAPLKEEATRAGLQFFSTAYDRSAVDFLDDLGVCAYKIASFELVDVDLIQYASEKGRPVIMSTGMADEREITEAIEAARAGGAVGVALLHCNSSYPAPPEEMDLQTIADMATRWPVPIGISDHTLDLTVTQTAVALGACIIERHLTMSRAEPSPDAAFSLEPSEFAAMVEAVRGVERVRGKVRYGASPTEVRSLAFRRSLFVVEAVRAGELFTHDNVRAIRPGHGLLPRELVNVIGRRAGRHVEAGTPLSWDLFAEDDAAKERRLRF